MDIYIKKTLPFCHARRHDSAIKNKWINMSEAMAKKVGQDLAYTRNQIITAEVCISRIYNSGMSDRNVF